MRYFHLLFISMCMAGCASTGMVGNKPIKGNVVEIRGTKGQWDLLVNHRPFRLKGVGVGLMEGRYEKADYLKLAKDLGANTVRTWGDEQGTREYLDRAAEYGLYVNAGIWLNPAADGETSYLDQGQKARLMRRVISYVKEFKNHPAIIFWNIGNEVIFWMKDEAERGAFCKFLEEVINEVHRIDPQHPVIYTSAFTTAVPYIKKYVPSLDIFGVNAYGGFEFVHNEIISRLDIPYLVTEFGPLGEWDRPKDMNGSSLEMTDDQKAHYYNKYAHKIRDAYGYCLGGFAFFLGDTTQVSYTWWNLTYGEDLKYAYMTVKKFYTGKEPERWPPVIKDIHFSKRKDLKPGEKFDVHVDVVSENGPVAFKYFATTGAETTYWDGYPNHDIPIEITGEGESVTIQAPFQPGLYRVYAVVRDGFNQASVFNKSISVKR